MNVQEMAELLRMSPAQVANARKHVKERLAEVLGREIGKRERRP